MARKLFKIAGLLVIVAALTAPVASAMRFAGDQGGSQGTGAVIPSDRATLGTGQYAADQQAAKTFKLPLAPDDRQGTAGTVPTLVIPYLSHGIGVDASQFSGQPVRPDDRATGARPIQPTSEPTVVTPVSSTGNDFSWGSAGVGAAGLAALGLVIALLAALIRRGRQPGVAVS